MLRKSIVVDLEVPNNATLQAAFGRVTMRHAHLDYMLRLTIKSITRANLEDALRETAFTGSKTLRKEILKEAKKKIHDDEDLALLEALLRRCESATKKRNELVHEPIVRKPGAQELRRFVGEGTRELPTVAELVELEGELKQLAGELRQARERGFLAQALAAKT